MADGDPARPGPVDDGPLASLGPGTVASMVPIELLYTAMLSGFAVALTGMIATIRVLGSRITDVRHDMNARVGDVREDMAQLRAELRDDVTGLRNDVNRRFDGVNTRFDEVTEQLTTVSASLGAIDARLTTLSSSSGSYGA
jgi:uncharacterized protein involved in exopolysaccharide biosynthesis